MLNTVLQILAYVLLVLSAVIVLANIYICFLHYPVLRMRGFTPEQARGGSGIPLVGSLLALLAGILGSTGEQPGWFIPALWTLAIIDPCGAVWALATLVWGFLASRARTSIGVCDDQITQRWLRAGDEFGIRVIAPARLEVPSHGSIVVPALIQDFGGPKGTVVVGRWARRSCKALQNHGYVLWFVVEQDAHNSPERQGVINMLCKWDWYGQPGEQPAWYAESKSRCE